MDCERIRRLSLRRLADRPNRNLLNRKHHVRVVLRIVERNLPRKPNLFPSLATIHSIQPRNPQVIRTAKYGLRSLLGSTPVPFIKYRIHPLRPHCLPPRRSPVNLILCQNVPDFAKNTE